MSPTILRMVTHQPKDSHPPEGCILQTRNLALRLNSQNWWRMMEFDTEELILVPLVFVISLVSFSSLDLLRLLASNILQNIIYWKWIIIMDIQKITRHSFCLISLAIHILGSWDTFHLKVGIHISVSSTKTFLYDMT